LEMVFSLTNVANVASTKTIYIDKAMTAGMVSDFF